VQDTNAPVITLIGDDPLAHELGEAYTDPGTTADDGSAVTIDGSTVDVNVEGDYVVTYTATDGEGNKGMASRTVEVRDTTKPVISINGGQSVTVELGGTYDELGATVSDNDPAYDGTASASETVDAGTVGVYTVTYTAPADAAGNEPDPVSRTVTVRDTAAPDPPRSPPKPAGPSGGGGAGSVTSEHNRGVNRNPLVYIHSVAWDCTAGTAIVAAGPAPDGTTVDFTERKITEVDHAVTDPAPNGMTATVFTLKSAQYQTGSSIRIGDTVVFTIPMHPEETYMAVQVAAEINGYMGQAAEMVNVDSCVGGKAFAGSDIIRLPQKTPHLEVGGRQISETEPSTFLVSMELDEAPEPTAKEHSDTEHRVSSDAKTMPEAASRQMAEQTHTEWTLAPCGEDGTLLADYVCTTAGQQGNNEDDIGAQNEPVEPVPTERCDFWCVLSSVFA